jgi:hypothetical protein
MSWSPLFDFGDEEKHRLAPRPLADVELWNVDAVIVVDNRHDRSIANTLPRAPPNQPSIGEICVAGFSTGS